MDVDTHRSHLAQLIAREITPVASGHSTSPPQDGDFCGWFYTYLISLLITPQQSFSLYVSHRSRYHLISLLIKLMNIFISKLTHVQV